MTQTLETLEAQEARIRALERELGAPPKVVLPVVPLWISAAGWYGVVAILGAYLLSTHDYIEQNGLYLFLNTTGALGVALLAWKKHAWQAVVLEAVWIVIGLSAFWRLVV